MPGLPTDTWFHLFSVLRGRQQADAWQERMARHLTHYADERGRVGDLEAEVVPGYVARHQVSRRTFYADLARLVDAQFLRMVLAPCPGRTAVYQLCAPSCLPGDLPASLRGKLCKLWARPTTTGKKPAKGKTASCRTAPAKSEDAVRVRLPLAEVHRVLAECVMVAYGAADHPAPRHCQLSRGRLHTSPLLKRALPHPLSRSSQGGLRDFGNDPAGKAIDEEGDLIGQVLSRSRALWGPRRAAGLTEEGQERLAPLIGGALRYLTTSDVVETMTTRVDSAVDLGAVLAKRLRAVIKSGRRARYLPVDEDRAERARAAADAAAAANHARPELRSLLDHTRQDLARRRRELRDRPARGVTSPRTGQPPPPPRPALTEPPEVFAAELGLNAGPARATPTASDLIRRQALARAHANRLANSSGG